MGLKTTFYKHQDRFYDHLDGFQEKFWGPVKSDRGHRFPRASEQLHRDLETRRDMDEAGGGTSATTGTNISSGAGNQHHRTVGGADVSGVGVSGGHASEGSGMGGDGGGGGGG